MDLKALSEKVGLVFPAGTELLGVRGESGMDEALFAKVAIGAADWAAFLTRSPFEEADFDEGKRYLLEPDNGWWDPESVPSLPTAQAPLPESRYLNVGVDRRDPARFVVYLMWHET